MATPIFERGRMLLRSPIPSDPKPRLVIIVSRNELNQGKTIVVVPLTSKQLETRRNTDYCVFFPAGCCGNDEDCVAKCDALAQVDKVQISSGVGVVDRKRMSEIDAAIKWALALP
jgi:mRNA-degrading endonuclease toxin of MazEF toxin-antitoxin module